MSTTELKTFREFLVNNDINLEDNYRLDDCDQNSIISALYSTQKPVIYSDKLKLEDKFINSMLRIEKIYEELYKIHLSRFCDIVQLQYKIPEKYFKDMAKKEYDNNKELYESCLPFYGDIIKFILEYTIDIPEIYIDVNMYKYKCYKNNLLLPIVSIPFQPAVIYIKPAKGIEFDINYYWINVEDRYKIACNKYILDEYTEAEKKILVSDGVLRVIN